jgi:hypothetical protein
MWMWIWERGVILSLASINRCRTDTVMLTSSCVERRRKAREKRDSAERRLSLRRRRPAGSTRIRTASRSAVPSTHPSSVEEIQAHGRYVRPVYPLYILSMEGTGHSSHKPT